MTTTDRTDLSLAIRVAPCDANGAQFMAHVAGLPEFKASAASREEAVAQLRKLLAERLSSGELAVITLPIPRAVTNSAVFPKDDPLEQEFLEALKRAREEDLERTLREYEQEDQGCSNTSSTPTT